MRKVLFLIAFVFLFLYSVVYAHSGKPDYRVIIDTDCAFDDFRAITMLLASSKVEVLGITTSDGTLDPVEGQQRIRSLLKCFHHEGIHVAGGEVVIKTPPAWRGLNKCIPWTGEEAQGTNINNDLSARDFIIKTISNEVKPVTVICLGSLTNIATAIQKEDSIIRNIERIIWYNRGNDIENGTNYGFDISSADFIIRSGIRIDMVSNPQHEGLKYDSALSDSIAGINSVYARQISYVHNSDELKNISHKGYLNIWDDLLPVYLLSPGAFTADSSVKFPGLRLVKPADEIKIKEQIIDILDIDRYSESKVFERFPADSSLYRNDVAAVMNEIIDKHGLQEWRLGVLTNEIHGHLGIYATVGVKMGLRAREYFNIGLDDIRIISYAGRQPPVSCMNDGLQVATGGTLGHGLIFLADETKGKPKAYFSYKDKTVIIRLKDEYVNIIKNDIKQCISEHGNLTNEYWECVRKLAIEYWLAWDRNIMFDLEY